MNAQINCTPTDREIAEIAYGLWEAEGRPEGQASLHWDRAAEMLLAGRKSPKDSPTDLVQGGSTEIGLSAPPA